MEQSEKLQLFFVRFRDFLKIELEECGVSMVKELVYRFAMVQLRDTRYFESGKIEYIPKVLAEMQVEFGRIFEDFAEYCFSCNLDVNFVNKQAGQWLKEILNEILPDQRS